MSERKQYDDGLIRVGLLLANKRKSLGEPYQTREAFIDLRSVELFDGEPWISIRHLANIESGKNWISIEKLFALAIALELTLDETDDLLERAGYALSHSQKFDVIVEFFIVSGKYDIFEINEVLFKYDQPLLGAG